jgi:hypothetical protein
MGWFGPISLGGTAKQIVVASNVDGRLEIFYIRSDNNLCHRFQPALNALLWTDESVLAEVHVEQIAVCANKDGRLEIFYTDSHNNLYNNCQPQAANITTDPTTLKLAWVGQHQFTGITAKQIALGRNFDGRLELFYTDKHNNLFHMWQNSLPVMDPAHPNAQLTNWSPPAAFEQAGKQLSVGRNLDGCLELFFTDSDSNLLHAWQLTPASVGNPNTFNGPVQFPKDSAQQISVGQNSDGRLEIIYVGTNNDLYRNWQTNIPVLPGTPETVTGTWAAKETRIAKNSALQVAVAADPTGALNIFYVGLENQLFLNQQKTLPGMGANGAADTWVGESSLASNGVKQIAAAANADGRFEIICINTDGKLYHYWQTADLGPVGSRENLVIADSGSLVASNNCKNLVGVFLVIDIISDLVCATDTAYSKAFSIQLNAYSPKGSKCTWQQYGFQVSGKKLGCFVNNWQTTSKSLINSHFNLASLPNEGVLPAGYQLQLSFATDGQSNLSEVTFTVFDELGQQKGNVAKNIKSLGNEKDLAPIVAFEVNVVGEDNQAGALFTEGQATIRYQAGNDLIALPAVPDCAATPTVRTQEIANTNYGAISPSTPSVALEQTLTIAFTANG